MASKILIHQQTGKKFFVKDCLDNFHTQYGIIPVRLLQSSQDIVESSKGEFFYLLDATFPDLWEQLNRGPQVMLPKDIGFILAKTGINRESRVVDAGGGSGSLCFSLANVCKEIVVYEINPEHYRLLLKNKGLCGFENIEIKQEDISAGIFEKDLDLVTLDLPEPWKVVLFAEKALKNGGYLVVYLPNLLQVKQFVDVACKTRFTILETVELLERRWKIEERIMRPEFEMLGHTGFLTFCRKM